MIVAAIGMICGGATVVVVVAGIVAIVIVGNDRRWTGDRLLGAVVRRFRCRCTTMITGCG